MLGFLIKMIIAGIITLAVFSGVSKLMFPVVRSAPITVIVEEPCSVDICPE